MCRQPFGDEQVLQGVQKTFKQSQLRLLKKQRDEISQINMAIESSTSFVQTQALQRADEKKEEEGRINIAIEASILPVEEENIDLTHRNRLVDYTPLEAVSVLLKLDSYWLRVIMDTRWDDVARRMSKRKDHDIFLRHYCIRRN